MVRPGQELDDTAGSPQEHAIALPTAAVPVPWLARLTRASRQQAPLGVGEDGAGSAPRQLCICGDSL